MTLYQFNILTEDNKLKTVWDIGEFIDNHISIDGIKNLYAINKFYVEVVYDAQNNQIIGVESFKTGKDLDKYLPDLSRLI
jgi:hypothetical protein